MLCENCKKKEATVFYEEIINGTKRSASLCSHCAAEAEKAGTLGSFSLPAFGGLGDSLFGGLFGLTEAKPQPKNSCPSCGATMNALKSQGKVGCPACYTTFGEELRGTIRSIHGNVKHVGRAPSRFRGEHEKSDRLTSLKQQLKDAIAEENFERAAAVRDEIRALEENP